MKLRLILAAATCLALPLAAHAQPVTGPYVSLEGGTSFGEPFNYNYHDQEDFGAGPPVQGPAGQFTTRESYAGVGAVGYGFGDGFRVELSGNFFRNTIRRDDNANNAGSYNARGGLNTYGPMLNILYDINFGLPIFPYVGVGGGYQWAKFNTHITDLDSYGDTVEGTRGSPAFDVIVGVSYPLPPLPQLSLTLEYRFTDAVETKNYDTTYPVPGGPSDGPNRIGPFTSHTILAGLRYQLFPPPVAAPPPVPAPVAAAPAPAPAKTYLVFFDWDKSSLTPRATQIIAEAASDSHTTGVTTINVSGYTDTSGTPTYNQGLSERRAHAVAAQLVTDGVPMSEIETHAYGETHLLVATGPGVREPQNRRVEIVLD